MTAERTQSHSGLFAVAPVPDPASALPPVPIAHLPAFATRMTDMLRGHVASIDTAYQKKADALAARKARIVEQQRKERAELEAAQAKRWAKETQDRTSRLNKGFRGIWDRITGKHARQTRDNERETLIALQRDRKEKDALVERHIDERQTFHQLAKQSKAAHGREVAELHRDIGEYMRMGSAERLKLREQFREASRDQGNYAKGQRHKDDPERSL